MLVSVLVFGGIRHGFFYIFNGHNEFFVNMKLSPCLASTLILFICHDLTGGCPFSHFLVQSLSNGEKEVN